MKRWVYFDKIVVRPQFFNRFGRTISHLRLRFGCCQLSAFSEIARAPRLPPPDLPFFLRHLVWSFLHLSRFLLSRLPRPDARFSYHW